MLPEFLKEQRTRILLGIALALVSLYILFALIGFFFSGGIDQSLVDGPWGKSLPIRKSKSVILPERSEPDFGPIDQPVVRYIFFSFFAIFYYYAVSVWGVSK